MDLIKFPLLNHNFCETIYLFSEPKRENQNKAMLDKDSLLATLLEMGISFEEAYEIPNLIDMGFTSSQIEKAVVEAATTNLEVLLDHMTQEGIEVIDSSNA